MKLPISLLVLVALSQAQSEKPVIKRSEAKSLEAKSSPAKSPVASGSLAKNSVPKQKEEQQKEENQTTKRELYEGNFGDRTLEVSPKYEVAGPLPKIVSAKEFQDMVSDTHQIFGMRLPQISKISDVLSEQNPGSYEAAVVKHLYSPISVYHPRASSPTSFEVPAPAASQSAYSNKKSYKIQKSLEKDSQNQQEVAPKSMEQPHRPIPLYTVNQPRLRFEAYPQALNFPQEIFQQVPRKSMPSLYPIYDQLGPFRHPGQVLSSQSLHHNEPYQVIPFRPDLVPGNQEENRNKNYSNQENFEQLRAERTQPQIDAPVPEQGNHAHPNGAMSFVSFSQNIPVNTQYEGARQLQSETSHNSQPEHLQFQPIPVQLSPLIGPKGLLQSQDLKQQVKQNLQLPLMFHRLLKDLEKYQPVFQPQSQHIQNQPRPLNALQQHLLQEDRKQLPYPQVIPLYHLPSFKPLQQSLHTSEPFLQHSSQSPIFFNRSPRPFSFEYQPPTPDNFDHPIEQESTQITSLPPLKPNYSKYVRPLEPQSHTTPVFLPTPLQPLPSSTPKQQPIADQLISSTTVQPNVKEQKDSEKQPIQEETKTQSQITQPLKPEIIHQSEPTVRPQTMQSTTYLPFVTKIPQSIHFQYSTPRPQYQPTIHPQPNKAPARHDVVIQRQEIQELVFEPSPHSSIRTQLTPLNERELLQLKYQPHHQFYEQLQPLSYDRELEDINTQQYLVEARQLQSQQKQDSSQQREPQQHLIQQNSHPLQLLQFQPQLLQIPQPEQKQSQQQQQVSNQAQYQQQQELQQAQYQKQHAAEQQVSNAAQQEHHEAVQAQQQQQESEQAQQQQQESEQAQQQLYQQQPLDSNNQIHISTLKPSEDTEKQTETDEIEQQTESHFKTVKPNEQPEHTSERIPFEQQLNLGPHLTPSVVPQEYARERQLVAQPEYSPLSSVPSYSDVQYFGTFAEKLFGNYHH